MSWIVSLMLLLAIVFVIATIFNVALYLFFMLLELVGAGVRRVLRSK